MHETSPHLDGQYAAFGKLIEGLEVVDKIAKNQNGLQRCSAGETGNEESYG